MNKTARTILIMAGGTGGHVFPALAVAKAFIEQGLQVEWLGTQQGIEARLVAAANIPLNVIAIEGVRGRGLLRLLKAPWRLVRATFQSMRIIYRLKPCCVLGLGGFVTGPGGVAAWLMRVPLIIHEQNAIPGLTNTWLAKLADKILSGFPGTFALKKSARVAVTGNPLRDNIVALASLNPKIVQTQEPLKVLVVGGSLGAMAINELMPHAISLIPETLRPQLWHQTGSHHLHSTQSGYEKWHVNANVVAFIDDMATAYRWADLVVCRAGALTVSELSAVGVASILIPYPHAVDDHQTANAMFLVRVNAALMLTQRDLSADALARLLMHFNEHRETLMTMALAARAQAQLMATGQVVNYCLEVVNGKAA